MWHRGLGRLPVPFHRLVDDVGGWVDEWMAGIGLFVWCLPGMMLTGSLHASGAWMRGWNSRV